MPGGPAGGHELPVQVQGGRRKHFSSNLQKPAAHLQTGLPNLPRHKRSRKQRIQLPKINPLVVQPNGKPIEVSKRLRDKRGQPPPKTNLISNNTGVNIRLKPKRVSKSPSRKRRVSELLKSK